jgi:hypothetical protein
MTLRADNRLSLDAYRREMKLGPTTPAPRLSAPTLKTIRADKCPTPPEELEATLRASVELERAKAKRGRHKFAAEPTDGPDGAGGTRRYRSKLEARLARRLEAERQMGGLVSFVPEVSVPVGAMGGKAVRHVIDQLAILEVRPDGTFVGKLIEAKGMDLARGKQKREAVKSLYGLFVEVVR